MLKGARTFPLQAGAKVPLPGSHGHLEARPKPGESWLGSGHNYGIALDGQYLLLDVDEPEKFNALGLAWPNTWLQKTRRGFHYLFRYDGPGKNARLPGADVKIRGYLVGPGSVVEGHTYEVLENTEPVPAPQWAVDLVQGTQKQNAEVSERSAIPNGEHDNFLVSVAGFLRGRHGLSEEAIAEALGSGPLSVLEGIDEARPYTESDLGRIAHSVAHYAAGERDKGWAGADLIPASGLDFVGPPTRWWLRGFIPRGQLVMLYGKGGIGKSSLGSWLAAKVTARGGKFGFIGIEESFTRFAWRAVLGGANPDMLFGFPHPTAISLPDGAGTLTEVCQDAGLDFLYFDSIYSHFAPGEGLNAAERARRCLAPLAETAQRHGITVLGVFHENKAGALLGSVEMENVARLLLHLTRGEQGSAYLSVEKTNFKNPETLLKIIGQEQVLRDPLTGEVQLEEQDDKGTMAPERMFVVEGYEEVSKRVVDIDEIEEPIEAKLEVILRESPDATNEQIAEQLGCSLRWVERHSKEVRRRVKQELFASPIEHMLP
jgi:hypothetical protein